MTKPFDTRIPTIMQYIRKNVPKDGLLDPKFSKPAKVKKIKLVV